MKIVIGEKGIPHPPVTIETLAKEIQSLKAKMNNNDLESFAGSLNETISGWLQSRRKEEAEADTLTKSWASGRKAGWYECAELVKEYFKNALDASR